MIIHNIKQKALTLISYKNVDWIRSWWCVDCGRHSWGCVWVLWFVGACNWNVLTINQMAYASRISFLFVLIQNEYWIRCYMYTVLLITHLLRIQYTDADTDFFVFVLTYWPCSLKPIWLNFRACTSLTKRHRWTLTATCLSCPSSL